MLSMAFLLFWQKMIKMKAFHQKNIFQTLLSILFFYNWEPIDMQTFGRILPIQWFLGGGGSQISIVKASQNQWEKMYCILILPTLYSQGVGMRTTKIPHV